MKVTLLSDNLQKKLALISRGVSTRTQLPILSNILFETVKGKLYLNSTDLEIGIQTIVPANIEQEGRITIPAKTFIDLINTFSSEKITMQIQGNTLEVKTQKTKSIFQTTSAEEFPKLFEEKGEEIMKIKTETMHRDFHMVIFAASADTMRPALSGVYIKKDLLVTTDGYRLCLKQEKQNLFKKDKEEDYSIIVPVRVLREVMAIKDDSEEINMFIAKDKNQVLFEHGDTVIVGRLIGAQFPDYQKIIPANATIKVVFDREEMLKAVKTSAIFAREAANIIRLSIKENSIVVSANTPSVGENTVEVEAKINGEESEIAFNARYLLEFLSTIEAEEIVFEMTTPTSPGVFKIKGDNSFLHLIMPIRVQGQGD